jgi:hypothetical protein
MRVPMRVPQNATNAQAQNVGAKQSENALQKRFGNAFKTVLKLFSNAILYKAKNGVLFLVLTRYFYLVKKHTNGVYTVRVLLFDCYKQQRQP